MSKTVRTNFDRHEARRDRRYALPPIKVTFAEGEFTTENWSLGGFLLPLAAALTRGTRFCGELALATGRAPHAFAAEVVRRNSDGIGCRFIEPSPELVDALDRAILGRLLRRPA